MPANMARLSLLLLLAACLLSARSVLADDFRPLYVEIRSSADGTIVTRIKPPPGRPQYRMVSVDLPEFCSPVSAAQTTTRMFHCSESLGDSRLQLAYPPLLSPMPAVVRLIQSDDSTAVLTLPAHRQSWTQPGTSESGSVVLQYTTLGVEHIWIGYDHLLFLLCLIWIAGSARRVLWMVSGFTAAHSVTLALATFQLIRLDVSWVETAIALSVLFLALEVVRNRRDTLTWRYPAVIASLFGLLHGFGFASVLAEIGLPDSARLAGLLFFNVGVEIGQLAFVLACAAVWRAAQAWSAPRLQSGWSLQRLVGYCVGCTAAFWVFERLSPLAA